MSDDAPQGQPDQRKHPRQLVLIPAYVGARQDSGVSFGLVRNISPKGAYFLTQQSLQPGDQLDLSLHLSGDPSGHVRQALAEVIRIEELDPDTTDLWFFGVGVRFCEELSDIEDEVASLAERLAAAT